MTAMASGAAGGAERGPGKRKGIRPPAAAEVVPPAAPLPPATEKRKAKPEAAPVAPLLVGPKQAAAMLGISERTLWSLTDSGRIPKKKIGSRVVYEPATLERYVASLRAR